VIASREESPAPHSEAPIPEVAPPVVRDSVENSVPGKNTKDEVFTKPSNRSLGNGLLPTLTDLQPHNSAPGVSLAGKANMTETPQPPAKERFEPATSMPLPAIQDLQNMPSRNVPSAGSTVRPANPAHKPTDGKNSLVSRSDRANSGKDESSNWLVIGAVVGAVGVLVFVLARRCQAYLYHCIS